MNKLAQRGANVKRGIVNLAGENQVEVRIEILYGGTKQRDKKRCLGHEIRKATEEANIEGKSTYS